MKPLPLPKVVADDANTGDVVENPHFNNPTPDIASPIQRKGDEGANATITPKGLSEHAQYTLAVLMGGALLIYVGWERSGFVVFVGIAMAIVGTVLLQRLSNRFRGRRVEQKAIRKLRLPDGWDVEANVPLPGMGDADLLVISPKGRRFSIEIKAFRGVALKQATIFSKGENLTYPSGQRIIPDPIHQAIQNAEILNATPVIWLPEAKGKPVQRFKKSGVIVAQGHRAIRRAIGASWF